MKAAITRKIGMTQIFDEKGNQTPVTLLEIPKNYVVSKTDKTALIGVQTRKRAHKPVLGLLKKAGIDAVLTKFKEFPGQAIPDRGSTVAEGSRDKGQGELQPFQPGDTVKVTGITKGKGFAGTVKRHGFRKGPVSHGSNNIRQPGSIGAQQPQRVIKGKPMAGHMGANQRTIKNLKIVEVQDNVIAVQGSIPGANKSWIYLWQQ